jgi:hypothetical protein
VVLTEVHQIRRGHKLFKFLDDLGYRSKSIFNMAKREGLWDNGWDIQSIGLPAWAMKQIEE